MSRMSRGNTYGEYVVIFGLLLVVCLGALQLLGGSISDLLGGKVGGALGSGGSSGNLMGILKPVPKTGSLAIGGGRIDPETGLPLPNSNSAAGGYNASSIEGTDSKSETSMAAALFMESLAAEDPANADLLLDMSKLLFRMGGVQGAYLETGADRDSSLELLSNGGYTKNSAFYDLQQMQRKLNRLMNQLPMGSRAYGSAQALVADANRIADSFLGNREYSRPAGTDADYSIHGQLPYLEQRAEEKLSDDRVDNRHEGTLDDALKSKGKRRRAGG